jgi:hypothetical protein
MPFTLQELDNITAAALDFHVKGPAFSQSIQEKPLLDAWMKGKKTFPGGKGNITLPVKFDYTSALEGYSHNDTVSYANPANLKRASYPWKELHCGITFTATELKVDGISVTDSTTGKSTSEHSDRDTTVLTGLLQDKLEDMSEGWARSFDRMLHLDGTQDSKEVPGLQFFIADDPTTGTVGGIDRASNTLWRNRALVGGNRITSSTSLQTLTKTLRAEVRQLRRYGGLRSALFIAGSGFIEKLEAEIHEKGYYTDAGFMKNGATEIGMADISMRGIGNVVYDPTLDDLGRRFFAYIIDTKGIYPMVMDGEDMKTHNPARPHDQYTIYRAVTWTGGLVAKMLNSSGVYEVAP